MDRRILSSPVRLGGISRDYCVLGKEAKKNDSDNREYGSYQGESIPVFDLLQENRFSVLLELPDIARPTPSQQLLSAITKIPLQHASACYLSHAPYTFAILPGSGVATA
jgi:hypothetical protein